MLTLILREVPKFRPRSCLTLKNFRLSLSYQDKLKESAAKAYLTCLDKVTQAVAEKEFEAIVPILTELRKSLVPREVFIEFTCQEVGGPNLDITKAPKINAQLPAKEDVPTDDPI